MPITLQMILIYYILCFLKASMICESSLK